MVNPLHFSKTGDLEFRVLADFLKANSSINCLKWGLSDHISTLFDVLRTITYITSIDLSVNQIMGLRAKDIADVLGTNTSITSSDLHLNYIGDEGAWAIVDALKNNTSVKKIDLQDNHISLGLKKKLKDFAQEKGIIITWIDY